MIESLHARMMVNVRNGGEVSDTFAITTLLIEGKGTNLETKFNK